MRTIKVTGCRKDCPYCKHPESIVIFCLKVEHGFELHSTSPFPQNCPLAFSSEDNNMVYEYPYHKLTEPLFNSLVDDIKLQISLQRRVEIDFLDDPELKKIILKVYAR